jgi:hypothetical protein
MKLIICLVWALFLAAVAALFGIRHSSSVRAEATDPMQPIRPVVVELFTSEGCSSCPPADALLAKLDQEQRLENAEIIALEEHVDYWNDLGWRDPFSSSQWTQRQQDYAASFRSEGVYTPQMIVDGRAEFVGSSQSKARSAIVEASRVEKATVVLSNLQGTGSTVHLKIDVKMLPEPASSGAQIWLAATESGLHSNVQRGENAGEDLHHAAVMRSLRKIGEAHPAENAAYSSEQDINIDQSWKRENLRLVVFVQDRKSRHILGAASIHLAQ